MPKRPVAGFAAGKKQTAAAAAARELNRKWNSSNATVQFAGLVISESGQGGSIWPFASTSYAVGRLFRLVNHNMTLAKYA